MRITSDGADVFVNKLTTGCKNLRTAKIGMVQIEENELRKMLNMPHMENLEVGITRFHSMSLAAPINLTELQLHFNKQEFNLSTFCKAFANLPKLKFLGMYDIHSEIRDGDDPVDIVYELTVAALSQDKKVTTVNSQSSSQHFDPKITIMKKQYDEFDSQILTLCFELRCKNFSVFCEKLTPYLKGYIFKYS